MKLIMCVLLFVLVGCSSQKNIEVKSFNLSEIMMESISLLRADSDYLYVNDLDTLKDPFLFTTNQLILLDADGNRVEQIPVSTNKRIVDFVKMDSIMYYMNLVNKQDSYQIELCKFDDNNQEVILQEYPLSSPYLYPKFIWLNGECCFKVENTLYQLKDLSDVFTVEEDWFISMQDQEDDTIYYKRTSANGYQLYEYKNGIHTKTSLNSNFGHFMVHDQKVYYLDLDTESLCTYDLIKETETVIYESNGNLSDFKVIEDDLVMSENQDLVVYNLKENKEVKRIEDLETMQWIYTNEEDVYLYSRDEIIKVNL